jgi:HEAT repeat protein
MNPVDPAALCLDGAPTQRAAPESCHCAPLPARRPSKWLFLLSMGAALLSVASCTSLKTGSFPDSLVVSPTSASGSETLLEVVRSSLDSESWQRNHVWTAKAEWDHRRQGFPLAQDLQWKFAKNWDPARENAESPATVDAPAVEKDRPAGASPKASTAEASQAATKSPTTDPKRDSPGDSTVDESRSTQDARAEPEQAPHWDGLWPLTVADILRPAGKSSKDSSGAVSPAMDEGVRCLRRLARFDNLVGWNAAILWAQQDPVSAVEVADRLQKLVVHPPQYVAETSEGATNTDNDSSSRFKRGAAKQPSDAASKSGSASEGSRKIQNTLSTSTRCAAAEAWCLVLAVSASDPIDGLAPAGRLLEQTQLPNEIRAELFRGVARWVPPVHIPRLANAFREGAGQRRPPSLIRRAAIDACLAYAIWHQSESGENRTNPKESIQARSHNRHRSVWPETVLNCRIDPDFEVRLSFIRWLGFARTEDSFELLKTQAEGAKFELRQAALESLGSLHTENAHAELKAQVARTRDALRAAAVHALAAWGLEDVVPFATDSSTAVRRVVAEELGRHATLDSAVTLSELAVDRSIEVQEVAVRAAAGWPDSLAFPLLLHAMRDSSAKTRHEAARLLFARKKITHPYRFDSPSEQREAAVTAIAVEIGSSLSYLDQILKREPRATAEVNELRATEVRAHLAALIENPADSPASASAREWLAGIGARDIPIVEMYLQNPTRASPGPIYHDVLPKVSPAYAGLVDLQNTDVNIRRRGAKTLADCGRAATLSRPVLLRLRENLAHESDEIVWRRAMVAIGSDSTDDCAELANLALQHRSAEVRKLGCEYLSRHGRPAHAPWLLGLLEDRDRGVQLAAIRALGNCGNQAAVRGLKPPQGSPTSPNLHSLLTCSDQEVRFAAAVSLCRLGAAEGMQELVRLSYHSNSSIREQAVKEMGLSGQTRFVQHLVTLGWTEKNDQVRHAILAALDRLVPPENRPAAVGGLTSWDAKIKCWVQWLERRDGVPVENIRAGSPLASRPGRDS